ncbi:MAG TPA: FAD-dependent oxidoreductase, partial [Adhaeribacter sp.]|nr:FAD-dependent oxidoreductase [Adhaeribacter sp.]
SAAISLKEKAPERSVLVLERGLFPSGASTRNAGFACFGSLTEILSDLKKTGPDKTLAVVEKRLKGLEKLRQRLGDTAMDYQPVGGYELIFDKELPALAELEKANELLQHLHPEGTYTNRPGLVKTLGFNPEKVKSVVFNPHEGHVHTGKMMQALLKLAQEKGIEVRTGAEVTAIDNSAGQVTVQVKEPVRGTVGFQAQKVAVCTNAFSETLLPGCQIVPGRGQVILTTPIPGLPWQGAFHFDEGYYYFRNVGNRVLFGGGRNLAFEAETTTVLQDNQQIQQELQRLLREVIIPGQTFGIEQQWSGIMGFTDDKQPIVKKLTDRMVLGFACNGMGVALATTIGEEVALLLADKT